MNFEILMSGVTLGEIKNSDALKFIAELGLEGDALSQAKENYFKKAVLALAKKADNFELAPEMVYYLEGNTIIARKQFEDKMATLTFDLVKETVVMDATINGTSKSKEYKEDAKISDIIKAFNSVIKKM